MPEGKACPCAVLRSRVELQQFFGHVLHGLAHAGLGLGPCLRAQVAERGLGAFRRAVFLDQVEASERNVEARAFGIFQQHELGVAVALIDFFQALVLADAVFDVDDIISDLQIAEVGEERGDFRFRSLRTRGHRFRFIEQIARAEDRQVGLGEHDAVGHVGFGQRGGDAPRRRSSWFRRHSSRRPGCGCPVETDVVFGEDVGQALDFSGVRHREQNLVAGGGELLYFFQHRRNRAVKARGRLRLQVHRADLHLRCA